jgi:uncharacterized membrane protein
LLIQEGANTKDLQNGMTAYDYACEQRRPEVADMIFFKGSLPRLYLARGLYVLFLMIPALSLGALLALNFIEHRGISAGVLAGTITLVLVFTIPPLFLTSIRILPLNQRLHVISCMLSVLFVLSTVENLYKKRFPSRIALIMRGCLLLAT